MKQKNLILMVVAVGCGLAAAFLTSRMNAKPNTEQAQMRNVLVAAKDLNPPTKFTKEALKDLVKWKLMNVNDIPENAIESEEELLDMTLHRPVAANVYLQRTDVNKNEGLSPPVGKTGLMSVKLPLAQVTPFIKPTSRVNLVGTVTNRKNQKVGGRVLIPNMHVMAVDSEYIPAPGAAAGRMQVQVITLAVSNQEATLIRMAETAGVTMSFVLIGEPNVDPEQTGEWDINEVIAWINEAVSGSGGESKQDETESPQPAPMFVKVPVATEDLPAGTELTDDVINEKFRFVDHVEAPATAVIDLKTNIGHFLVKEVSANQFLSKSAVSKMPPKKVVQTPKVGADDAATPKPTVELPAEEPMVEVKKKPTLDKKIVSPTGTKTYRYEQQDDETWKLLGEVKPDGSVVPTDDVAPPAPTDDDKPEPKKPAPGKGRVS